MLTWDRELLRLLAAITAAVVPPRLLTVEDERDGRVLGG